MYGNYELKAFKKNLSHNLSHICNQFHNILRLLMFRQTFFSPQVKRWAIVTYKHGLYELPHELPNNLRLRILEN